MFEKYAAANAGEPDANAAGTENENTASVSPSGAANTDATKAYSERLNADRERIRQEERERLQLERTRIEDEVIANAGFFDELGNRMTTKSQFDQWQSRRADTEIAEEFETDPAAAVKKLVAKELTAKEQEQARLVAEYQRKQAAGMAVITEAVQKIAAKYPNGSIKTVEDFEKIPKLDEIERLVLAGYTVVQAYEKANAEEIADMKIKAAHQAALNSTANRSHLHATGNTGGDDVVVPDSVKREIRSHGQTANYTDEQIRNIYLKYGKRS